MRSLSRGAWFWHRDWPAWFEHRLRWPVEGVKASGRRPRGSSWRLLGRRCRFHLDKVNPPIYQRVPVDLPAVSTPAGPPPAIRMVDAFGRSRWSSFISAIEASCDPWRVHNAEVEVVPVAMIRESYETVVVVAGAVGSIAIVLRSWSRAVAEPNTRVNFSGEYFLKASSSGRNAFEIGIWSGLAMTRGAPIFQKKCVDGEIRVTL